MTKQIEKIDYDARRLDASVGSAIQLCSTVIFTRFSYSRRFV